MSDNPFESPQAKPDESFVVHSRPNEGASKAIAIICLVLGIMGLLSVCTAVGGLAFQSFSVSMIEQMPDSAQKDLQQAQLDGVKQLMIPIVLVNLVALVVATMLVVGGIGALSYKEKFRNILRVACYLAAGYQLVKIGFSAYSTFYQLGAMREIMDNPEMQADGQAAAIQQMTEYLSWGGFAVGVVIALGLLAFYLWSANHLQKPEVAAQYK